MALIKYTGLSHFRELMAEDFAKLGVETRKALTWARGEIKEVEDDVADVLHKLLSAEFTKVEEDVKSATSKTKKSTATSAPTSTSTDTLAQS